MNPEEVMERARQLRAAGVPLAEIEKYVASKMGPASEPVAKVPTAASDATRVAPRGDGGGDLEALLAPGQGKVLMDDVVPALGAHAINAAQSIPFMRNVQAGALAATSDMDYGQSKTALDDLTGEIPGDLRMGEQIATGALPWTKGASIAAPIAARVGRSGAAFAKELPVIKQVTRGAEKARRAWNAGKPVAKMAPKASAAVEEVAPKAQTLEDLLGSMEVLPEQAAPTLEEAIGMKPTAAPWKPRSAPKARFAHFAEQMGKRQSAQSIEQAEPTLEDLLAASLEHIQKGGSLRQASDAASKVRLVRP